MLRGFLILILCQFAGELLVGFFDLIIPAPVIGMVLLLIGLMVSGHVPDTLDKAAQGLLHYIGLLFVPAGAGISLYLGLLVEEWDIIMLASVTSTILTLITAAWVFQLLKDKG